jgi:hypothetical protein
LPGGIRAKSTGIGRDPNPSEVEPISIPANCHRDIRLHESVAVVMACIRKKIHFFLRNAQYPRAKLAYQLRAAPTVSRIRPLVAATGIVQESKQLYDPRTCLRALGDRQAMQTHARPMSATVRPMPIDVYELAANGRHQLGRDRGAGGARRLNVQPAHWLP